MHTMTTPDFSIRSDVDTLLLRDGRGGAAHLFLTANTNFGGPVLLTCTDLPAQTACSFSQSNVMLATGATTATTLVVSPATSSSAHLLESQMLLGPLLLSQVLLGLLAWRWRARYAGPHRTKSGIAAAITDLSLSALLAFAGSCLTGCGNLRRPAPVPGTYGVTIHARPTGTEGSERSLLLHLKIVSSAPG